MKIKQLEGAMDKGIPKESPLSGSAKKLLIFSTCSSLGAGAATGAYLLTQDPASSYGAGVGVAGFCGTFFQHTLQIGKEAKEAKKSTPD
jgi:hypothetical protein